MHVHDILAAIPLDRQSGTPLFRQLYLPLKEAILAGDVGAGVRLPATRALGRLLNVSRQTVLAAYEQLMAEGYLQGAVGKGTFVSASLPAAGRTPMQDAAPPLVRPLSARGEAMATAMARVRHHDGAPCAPSASACRAWTCFRSRSGASSRRATGAAVSPARPAPAGLQRRRRPSAAARTAVRLPEGLARRALRAGADHRHRRFAAGLVPAGPAAAGAGRRRVAGVAGLPGRAGAVRGGGRPHLPGAGRRRGHGCAVCRGPLSGCAHGLRHALAPAAAGRDHEPGAPAAAAALGRPPTAPGSSRTTTTANTATPVRRWPRCKAWTAAAA
jgi:DNA-binding transcriptional regulator YhcF (GntR family)